MRERLRMWHACWAMFNTEETLSGGTTLPGLEIPVADLFR